MKRILHLLVTLIMIPLISSCGESKAEKEARLERERQEQIRIEKEKEAARQEKEIEEILEREYVETSKAGYVAIERIMRWAYNRGMDDGSLERAYRKGGGGRLTFRDDDEFFHTFRVEEKYKKEWTLAYGVPTTEKEKQIFDKAQKEYFKGFKEAFYFVD